MADDVQTDVGERVKRQPSRGMYVLPSLFTAGNMAAGYYAITQSIQGSVADQSYFDRAALALGIAVLFDGLDGMIARMTNTASDFGKELDSLADVDMFGVALGLLAYIWGFRMLPVMAHPQLREQLMHIGIFCMRHLPDLRSEPAGTVQHQHQSSAAQSRATVRSILLECQYPCAGVISSCGPFSERVTPIDNPWIVARFDSDCFLFTS